MNGFHDTTGLLRQIETVSTGVDTILRAQKALNCSPVLEGIRRSEENIRRMQKALDLSPMLEGIRRAEEVLKNSQLSASILRAQRALDCSPVLEGIRRSEENIRRMQKALDLSPMLEGIRRAEEVLNSQLSASILRAQKALDCSPVLEGIRRSEENIRRMQKALDLSPMLEGIRRAEEVLKNSQLSASILRAQRALDCSPVLEGIRRSEENRLVAHDVAETVATREKAQGRGRRLGEFGQAATNWLVRLASRRKVRRPVGSSLRGVAEFVFSKKSYEQIYDPLISDLRVEYCDALALNRRWKARWVRARGYGSFLKAVLAHAAASPADLVVRVCRIFWPGG